MSLNWKEIDSILAEIPLENSFIRQIHQPRHHLLVLELFNRGSSFRLLFSFANPHCRLHLTSRRLANPKKPQRFAAFLRSRTRNGRILKAYQVGNERIVKLKIQKGDVGTILWARFWGGAANMIATDADGCVLDALYRRPNRNEISGGFYNPEQEMDRSPPLEKNDYSVRELPGDGSFNQKIEGYYFDLEQDTERERLSAQLLRDLTGSQARIEANREKLNQKLKIYRYSEQFKTFGDLILSNIHTIKKGDRWLRAEQFEQRKVDGAGPADIDTIEIELDPLLKPAENAESYFRKYRKAKSGQEKLAEEIKEQERQLERVQNQLARIPELDLETLRSQFKDARRAGRRGQKDLVPGLGFQSSGFRILVGRTARENDELLRRQVRGNDIWFHVRDSPCAYVFVRTIAGKSLPLDVMLDAGNLALFYSKGKSSGQGDVYYTRVKYLKRVKKGKIGLVIPTQEKNLLIKLDEKRLVRLRETRG